MAFIRVGIAYTRPRGEHKRKSVYGLWAWEGAGAEDIIAFAKYEGYDEQQEEGVIMVGLPFAGPNAVHLQPFIPFVETHYDEVRYFKRKGDR